MMRYLDQSALTVNPLQPTACVAQLYLVNLLPVPVSLGARFGVYLHHRDSFRSNLPTAHDCSGH